MARLTNERIHIGIVAGTADGAALCYQALCHEGNLPRCRRPEISMHMVPLDLYLDAIDEENWKGVAALMSQSASVLAQAGADVIICPNNTLHRAFDLVVSAVPWLHIADAVRAEASRRTYRKVGLLGTQVITEGTVYHSVFEPQGIEIVVPRPEERMKLDRLIRTELVQGDYLPHSRRYVEELISTMAADGAEAVILGCTELPLLVREERSALPLLDSTRLLAAAALTTFSSLASIST